MASLSPAAIRLTRLMSVEACPTVAAVAGTVAAAGSADQPLKESASMSLFPPASQVTAADIANLEQSIQFFQSSAANQKAVATAIQNGRTTVTADAGQLLSANIATSQFAMANNCLMLGLSPSIATLTNEATVFLPGAVALAVKLGTNQVATAAEALGVALADTAGFAPFLGTPDAQFTAEVATATGVNVAQINIWLANWTAFYTKFGTPAAGVTIQEAARGATFGDAIGVALQNPTSANLQTTIGADGAIHGEVANDLLTIATGQYVVGVDCDTLPPHTPLEGEPQPPTGFTLTIGVDTQSQGFTTGTGATATLPNQVFTAPPGGNPPLGTTNTLNAGDTLVSTVDPTSAGATILNFTAVNNLVANPAFA